MEQVWPAACANRSPEITVTIVAGPDPFVYWREHTGLPTIPRDDRIRLLEFVADVRPLYVEANLVLVPTLVSAGTNLKVLGGDGDGARRRVHFFRLRRTWVWNTASTFGSQTRQQDFAPRSETLLSNQRPAPANRRCRPRARRAQFRLARDRRAPARADPRSSCRPAFRSARRAQATWIESRPSRRPPPKLRSGRRRTTWLSIARWRCSTARSPASWSLAQRGR